MHTVTHMTVLFSSSAAAKKHAVMGSVPAFMGSKSLCNHSNKGSLHSTRWAPAPPWERNSGSLVLSTHLTNSALMGSIDSCTHCEEKQRHLTKAIETMVPNGVRLALDSRLFLFSFFFVVHLADGFKRVWLDSFSALLQCVASRSRECSRLRQHSDVQNHKHVVLRRERKWKEMFV